MSCKHAASGCNYPEGECAGACMERQGPSDDARYLLWVANLWRLMQQRPGDSEVMRGTELIAREVAGAIIGRGC
jgi:hypothetical protein